MFFKNFQKTFITILLAFFIIPSSTLAYSDYIIAGGENIGIKLNSKGIMVVGMYDVNNTSPADEAGIQIGDIVTSINGKSVATIDEMIEQINQHAEKGTIDLQYLRNGKTIQTSLKIYKDENNVYKTGLYVKDNITGIGTLTFIDPKTNLFGALGHEITEKATGKILEIKDGKIFASTVTGIQPSTNGSPGEKNAHFYADQEKGNISENTSQGIFGTYTEPIPNKKLYKVANANEIKKGEAKILTVTNGETVEEYSIEILKLTDSQKTKNILFEITDQRLLELSNGIVQGMSGSPIIQNDKIIGAVTHVVLNDPTKGYGIFITNMLEEAEN